MKRRVCIIEKSYYYVDVEVDEAASEDDIAELAEQQYEECGADDFGESYIEVGCTDCAY